MLLQDDNGLDVRQLVVADNPDVFSEAMAPFAIESTAGGVDSETSRRLKRNGFRLLRVPSAEVEQLISDLGGASMDVASWYGQVVEWRDVHSLQLGEAGHTMAVDGRVRRYQGGSLRLMARSWVLPMEYGPRVQLEIVPQHIRGESQYHRLLGQSRALSEPIASLAAQLLLEPGYTYILTCECPQIAWGDGEQDSDGARQPDAASAMGPSAGVGLGPQVQAPMTLGQLMLTSHSGRRSRGMILFTPRIAAELFPPGEPLTVARSAAGERR